MYRRVLLLFCVFLGVQSINLNVEPCGKHDNECITKLVDKVIKIALNGDPALGMETLDPMFQEHIEGKFSIIKYQMQNSTIVGFKNCNVVNAKVNWENLVLTCELYCPYIYMSGFTEVSGKLIIVPIEGKGEYRIDAKDYDVSIDADFKFNKGKDGKDYLSFKNFKITRALSGGMRIDIKNLFNGQYKELADAALKFANEEWKAVAEEFQEPILNGNLKKIIKHMNKFLKHIPIDKLLVQNVIG